MIPTTTRIFVCTAPVDMRRSFDGLARCTRELLEQDPASGALFLFTGKRGTSLKALWWDRTGYCILYKRLARGTFRLPAASEHTHAVLIDARELALILEGIELPTRKLKVKSAAKESRQRALHAIASMTTDGGA
ncbi:MAG TPA: IS66 family insertion sequence element accessory protein TnpB [Polyangiaceae bacterium]|nr:IS66 family insertion sequence element accessory protein TnpB [Polyangiaceae bacterium]